MSLFVKPLKLMKQPVSPFLYLVYGLLAIALSIFCSDYYSGISGFTDFSACAADLEDSAAKKSVNSANAAKSAAKKSPDAAKTKKMLEFFISKPLGELRIKKGMEWVRYSNASGKVLVPEDAYLQLKLNWFIADELSRSKKPDNNLRKLFEHLYSLDLSGCELSENQLSFLAQMPGLVELNLRRSSIKDNQLVYLRLLKKLKSLDLGETEITDAAMPILASFALLENLSLFNDEINDRGLQQLAQLKLRSIELSGSNISEQGLAFLCEIKTLQSLQLGNLDLSSRGLEALSNLTELTSLSIDGISALDSDSFTQLARFKRLRFLNLARTGFRDSDLCHLKALNDIQGLDLSNTLIRGSTLSQLCKLPRLWSLNLSGTAIDDNALAKISCLKNLRILSLTDCKVSKKAELSLRRSIPGLLIKN